MAADGDTRASAGRHHGLLRQFLTDVEWGEFDYLVRLVRVGRATVGEAFRVSDVHQSRPHTEQGKPENR